MNTQDREDYIVQYKVKRANAAWIDYCFHKTLEDAKKEMDHWRTAYWGKNKLLRIIFRKISEEEITPAS